MSQRRMFSPDIVESEEFLTMPLSTQSLYFHLGMNADDDGFVQPKLVMRQISAADDDLKVLLAKRFVLAFESGVIVIKHWLIHNMIRNDRYKPTRFQVEKNRLKLKENKAYTEIDKSGCQNGNQMATQVRLDKVRLDDNNSEPSSPNLKDLYSSMGLPKPVRKVNLWQDEAANAVQYFHDGEEKRSSVFKCFKDNQQKARIAFSDCKELEKKSVMYFLKVYNEIKK